jgi:hypothetical protein
VVAVRLKTMFTTNCRTWLQVAASMFELGCVFHSFIIGITLGVNTNDLATVSMQASTEEPWICQAHYLASRPALACFEPCPQYALAHCFTLAQSSKP